MLRKPVPTEADRTHQFNQTHVALTLNCGWCFPRPAGSVGGNGVLDGCGHGHGHGHGRELARIGVESLKGGTTARGASAQASACKSVPVGQSRPTCAMRTMIVFNL